MKNPMKARGARRCSNGRDRMSSDSRFPACQASPPDGANRYSSKVLPNKTMHFSIYLCIAARRARPSDGERFDARDRVVRVSCACAFVISRMNSGRVSPSSWCVNRFYRAWLSWFIAAERGCLSRNRWWWVYLRNWKCRVLRRFSGFSVWRRDLCNWMPIVEASNIYNKYHNELNSCLFSNFFIRIWNEDLRIPVCTTRPHDYSEYYWSQVHRNDLSETRADWLKTSANERN